MHGGALAPGMNTATRALVRFGVAQGHTMLGVNGSFPGWPPATCSELSWGDVEELVGEGGSSLGTRRDVAGRRRALRDEPVPGAGRGARAGRGGWDRRLPDRAPAGHRAQPLPRAADADRAAAGQHRQQPAGHGAGGRRGHRAQQRGVGAGPDQAVRVGVPAVLRGRDDGPQLRLPDADDRPRCRRGAGVPPRARASPWPTLQEDVGPDARGLRAGTPALPGDPQRAGRRPLHDRLHGAAVRGGGP